jgi:large subunit ribosomal protein L31e
MAEEIKQQEEKVKPTIADVKKAIQGKKKESEKKVELDRIYVVPLRKGYLKVPQYKRAKKAVKTLKEFLAKHMRVENRDLDKVKVDMYLNNEIWFRGIKKPLNKVKVHAKKIDGIVYAELAEVPEIVKFKMQKDAKRKTKVDKAALEKVVTKEVEAEKAKEGRENQETIEVKKEKVLEEAVEVKKEEPKKKDTTAKVKPADKGEKNTTVQQRKTLKK